MRDASDSQWQEFLGYLKEHNMGTYILMRRARVRTDTGTTIVAFGDLFRHGMITSPVHRDKVRRAMLATGIDPTWVSIRLEPGDDASVPGKERAA